MGFLTKEFRTRLKEKLTAWAESGSLRSRLRLYELIGSLPDYVEKYGGYTLTTFVLSLPFNLGNRKQDAADLITQLYLVVLEAKNIAASSAEKDQIAEIARQIVNNGPALKKAFDEIKAAQQAAKSEAGQSKPKGSMFKSAARMFKKNKEPLAANILEMLERHGLASKDLDGEYNLDAIPLILFLHLVKLEQDLDLTGKINDLIGDDPKAIGDLGNMLIKFKQNWPDILKIAQDAVLQLVASGLQFDELNDPSLAIYILFHRGNDQVLKYLFAQHEQKDEVDSLALSLVSEISNLIVIRAELYESSYEINVSKATRLLRQVNGITDPLIKKEMQVAMLSILLDSKEKYEKDGKETPHQVLNMIGVLNSVLEERKSALTNKNSINTSGASDNTTLNTDPSTKNKFS